MKVKQRRILSLLLALCMVFSLVPDWIPAASAASVGPSSAVLDVPSALGTDGKSAASDGQSAASGGLAEDSGGTAELLGAGIVFDNNACPWSNDMTVTGFTLNIITALPCGVFIN